MPSGNATEELNRLAEKNEGEAVVQAFQRWLANDQKRALSALNDESLHYPVLYMLRNRLMEKDHSCHLCDRNRLALQYLHAWMANDATAVLPEINIDFPTEQALLAKTVLIWMVETGGKATIDGNYMETMDICCATLLTIYRETKLLPRIADMIFQRYALGLPYYTLAWAFFEAKEPYSLFYLANGLRSRRKTDRRCAAKLLSFVPKISEDDSNSFSHFCSWFEKEGPFLWYKGESFDTIHRPRPYVVALAEKYLGYFVCPENGRPLFPVTRKDKAKIREFLRWTPEQQAALAERSAVIRRKNRQQWLEWMKKESKTQLEEMGEI